MWNRACHAPHVALSREQVADRIVAARRIRGFDQLELERRFYEAGEGEFPKGALGEIERKTRPLGEGGRTILARLLNVPAWWFVTEDPFEPLRNGQDPTLSERVERLEVLLSQPELLRAQEREEVREVRPRARSGSKTARGKRATRKSGEA